MRPRRSAMTIIAALILALPLVGWTASTASAAPPGAATLSVVHGIPGVPVDVFVDGALTLEDFQPETVTDPIPLPPGDYTIDVVEREGGTTVISDTVTLGDRVDASAVASILGDGSLGLQVFEDDTSQLDRGTTRYQLRNTGNTPDTASGLLGSDSGFGFLRAGGPGEQSDVASIDTEDGPFAITGGYGIAGPGTRVSFFAGELPGFESGVDKAYNAYIIGSAEDPEVGSLTVVVQELQTAPQPERNDAVIPVGGADSGIVSVVHGIPGAVVDVYVDGELALEDLVPETVTPPIELPAGERSVVVVPADGDPATDALIDEQVIVEPRSNASVVASILGDGALGLQAFANETDDVRFGQTRYRLRNTGDTPDKVFGILGSDQGFGFLTAGLPGEESEVVFIASAKGPFAITAGYGTAGAGTRVPFFAGELPNFGDREARSYVGYVIGTAVDGEEGSLTVVVQELTSSEGTEPTAGTETTRRIEATSFSSEFGRRVRGDERSVRASDDERLRQRTRFDADAGLDRQELVFALSAPRGEVLDLSIDVESRIRRQARAEQTVSLLNWDTGEFEPVSRQTVRSGRDQRFEIDDIDGTADYVRSSDGSIRIRVETAAELGAGERLVAQFDEISADVTVVRD